MFFGAQAFQNVQCPDFFVQMLASDRRYSTAPEEENAESITELITSFLDNLSAQQDRQAIVNVNQQMDACRKLRSKSLEKQLAVLDRNQYWYRN